MQPLSDNTKAILLLTAPLIVGRGSLDAELLSPSEYKRFAQRLRDDGHQPADLLGPDAGTILEHSKLYCDADKLKRLLARGMQLTQAVERWKQRAIWVVSRADLNYPRRLKGRLKSEAPAILYGCGELAALDDGGLAVVGSRHVDDELFRYAMDVGGLAARANRPIISGGAKGIDQAAMRGALEAGGRVCGVLADSLEKQVMTREHRNMLVEGQLVLVSPYDPNAGFNTGNAMQRNKLVYALSDAALVVSSDVNKGGTWTGAVEQLNKHRCVPVYVRSVGAQSTGLDALRKRGALSWSDPKSPDDLQALLDGPVVEPDQPEIDFKVAAASPERTITQLPIAPAEPRDEEGPIEASAEPTQRPSDRLFTLVSTEIIGLAQEPISDADVAKALDVTPAQAKAWLKRLVEGQLIEKSKNPAGYVARARRLI